MGLSIIIEKITSNKKPEFFYFNNYWNVNNWLTANVSNTDKMFEVSKNELKDLLKHLNSVKNLKENHNNYSYPYKEQLEYIDEEIKSIETILNSSKGTNPTFYYSYCN